MKIKAAPLLLIFFGFTFFLPAQALREVSPQSVSLPLKRIVIFSSGLGYFEHSAAISGPSVISLPFSRNAINDALKSLVINDPSSANPSVVYQSESALYRTLRSLKIDLSGSPGLVDILRGLTGAEITVAAPDLITGRIAGVEYRASAVSPFSETNEPWLLLSTRAGLRLINIKEISVLQFSDPELNRDLERALDLLLTSQSGETQELTINLPGSGSRTVSASYVIAAPVWKVSYRLDLSVRRPLLQGWAIVDNDSDIDWKDIELSLVAGRPASFIQNLYPPYYVSRPVLPLAIAGAAEGVAHDSGYSLRENNSAMTTADKAIQFDYEGAGRIESQSMARAAAPAPAFSGGVVETASAAAAGDQFEFTINRPVSLNRRMSAMLPLVESAVDARKVLIFSGGSVASGANAHPRVGAEITNTSGMRLPAGPITVYDGVYAGDALIEFWNENEKRLISFAEDLSVTGSAAETSARTVSAVTISGGVMHITRSLAYIKTYTFRNADSESKELIVEHQRTSGTTLVSPNASEQTASGYRFNMTLSGGGELAFTVREERPIQETITLLSMRQDTLLSYTTNQEIPQIVRTALLQAAELKRKQDTADAEVRELEASRSRAESDQDRIRRNLEAVGSQNQQGQDYLRRLEALEREIDNLSSSLDRARTNARAAALAYENYLRDLKI
jgi:hypothetical protein